MRHPDSFRDKSATCSRTYATLCIYHDSADPREITNVLKLIPERSQKAGGLTSSNRKARTSGWFLGTKDVCSSKDFRTHIRWILKKLTNKKKELQTLCESGYEIWVYCFWESTHGNGGPILDHGLIKHLSEFPIDLFFDIWFPSSERLVRMKGLRKIESRRKMPGLREK